MNQTAFIMQKFELYDHEHYNNSNSSYLVYVVETVSFSFFKLLLLLYIYIYFIYLVVSWILYKSRVKKDRIISEITAHSFCKQRNP